MKVSKSKLKIVVLITIFYQLVEYVYISKIHSDYWDLGFAYQWDTTRYLVAKICFVIVLIFTAAAFDAFLFSFFSLFIALFLAPNLVLYQFANAPAFIFLAIAFMIFATSILEKLVPGIKSSGIKDDEKVLFLAVIAVLLLIPFVVTYGFPASWNALALDVYEVREESAEQGNIFTRYFYSWLSYWILPICVILGYEKKNYFVAALGLVGALYLFLITGNKVTLFAAFAIGGFLLFRTFYSKVTYFLLFLVAIFSVALIFPDVKVFANVQDLLVRRFLFLPALLNLQYIEYFQEPLYLSHSVLSRFSEYPYDLPPPRLIGRAFYGNADANMTNGVISDGYINFGVPGVFIIAACVAFIISYFHKLGIKPIYFGLSFLLIQNFIDNAFFTSLITHGVLIFMFIATITLKSRPSDVGKDVYTG